MRDVVNAGYLKFVALWTKLVKQYNEHSSLATNIMMVVAVIVGWRLRRHELITPTHGLGFEMGIFGTLFIVFVFVYPLRKRVKSLAWIGPIKDWFQIHMFMGLLGPVVILYHCNFSLGAFNSNIALFSLLIVSASGVVGKHIYTKITKALNGERINLISLQRSFEDVRRETYVHFVFVPGVKEELNLFAGKVITPTKILMVSIRRVFEVGHQAVLTRHNIRKLIDAYLDDHAQKRHWSPRRKHRMLAQMLRKSRQFIDQAVKVADFNFYERVFSLWHVMHLPLTFIFIATLFLHIFSVNRY